MTCKNTHHSLDALYAEAKKSIDVCSFMIATYQVNICGILNLPRKYKRDTASIQGLREQTSFPNLYINRIIEYALEGPQVLVGLSSQNNEQMKIPTNSHCVHIIH